MKSLIELGQRGMNTLQLICFWNNDDIIYHQREHAECLYASYWNGIENVSEKNEFIFPNPTNGKLTIDNDIQVSLIQIYDTKGNKLVEQKHRYIKSA
jgi:Secretion system C-terminal sorting domain